MSGRVRALARLRHARERLRDVAAAKSNVAATAVAVAMAAEDDARADVEARLDHPPVDAPRIADLMTYDDERRSAQARVVTAVEARLVEEERAASARAALSLCERALRVTERQIAEAQRDAARRRERAEQKLGDDLSGRRSS